MFVRVTHRTFLKKKHIWCQIKFMNGNISADLTFTLYFLKGFVKLGLLVASHSTKAHRSMIWNISVSPFWLLQTPAPWGRAGIDALIHSLQMMTHLTASLQDSLLALFLQLPLCSGCLCALTLHWSTPPWSFDTQHICRFSIFEVLLYLLAVEGEKKCPFYCSKRLKCRNRINSNEVDYTQSVKHFLQRALKTPVATERRENNRNVQFISSDWFAFVTSYSLSENQQSQVALLHYCTSD